MRDGVRRSIRARLVVDASGPSGVLSRFLGVPVEAFPGYPATEALYTHFTGVPRLDELAAFGDARRRRPIRSTTPPCTTSSTAAGSGSCDSRTASRARASRRRPRLARELRFEDGAAAWDRLLSRLPSVAEQFCGARAILPFVHRPRLAYRAARAAGPGWVLLPSAAAFVDPLLSTGFPLALLGILRLARIVEESWGRPDFDQSLAELGRRTLDEADAAARLTAALYASLGDFPAFALLTRLYFAAASWAEAARRLGKPERARSFLLFDDPVFGPALRRICDEAVDPDPGVRRAAAESVRAAIEPFDVIGLNDEIAPQLVSRGRARSPRQRAQARRDTRGDGGDAGEDRSAGEP